MISPFVNLLYEFEHHRVSFLFHLQDICRDALIAEGDYVRSGRELLACRREPGETGAARQSNIFFVLRRRRGAGMMTQPRYPA
ncbi:hypothetical protein [Bordetella bronchiseptica]|uniref:hypothetical protein n=1 Tax=Bordetella bronchiseptica TaxID=518 RepID=UPI000FDBF8DB|nr:hypothetical protein [Bordetella bronchiseptica]